MTYKLYWHPGVSSLAPMAVLEETGADYEAILVNAEAGEHQTETYRRIHPYGRIPALVLPDGQPMFESAAITIYVADQFPESGLAPKPGSSKKAHYYQWILFLTDTLYPTYNRMYHPERYIDEPSLTSHIEANCEHLLIEQWEVVENALADRDWLLGHEFSAADVYLMMVVSWDKDLTAFRQRCPNITRVARAASERPAVRRAINRHTVNLP